MNGCFCSIASTLFSVKTPRLGGDDSAYRYFSWMQRSWFPVGHDTLLAT